MRRRDHRDAGDADAGREARELERVVGRLGTAVRDDRRGPAAYSSMTRFGSGMESRIPSPVDPSAEPAPITASRYSRYGATAASSSALPPSFSGVSAAGMVRGTRRS